MKSEVFQRFLEIDLVFCFPEDLLDEFPRENEDEDSDDEGDEIALDGMIREEVDIHEIPESSPVHDDPSSDEHRLDKSRDFLFEGGLFISEEKHRWK